MCKNVLFFNPVNAKACHKGIFAIAEFQMHVWRLTEKMMQLIYKWNRNKN